MTTSGWLPTEFRSIDKTGNIGAARVWLVQIDLESPASGVNIFGQPLVADIGPDEIVNGNWSRRIKLEASWKGNDKDGRHYTIRVTATDNAGNTTVNEIIVIVPNNQGQRRR